MYDYEDGDGREVASGWEKRNADVELGWTPSENTVIELSAGKGDGESRYAGRGMDASGAGGRSPGEDSCDGPGDQARMNGLNRRPMMPVRRSGPSVTAKPMQSPNLQAFQSRGSRAISKRRCSARPVFNSAGLRILTEPVVSC